MKARNIAILVGALVVAYPASSWYLGRQVNSTLETQYQKLAEYPFLKLVDRKYEGGVFQSTETATFEVMPELFKAMNAARNKQNQENEDADESEGGEQADATPAAPAAPTEPLRFTTRSVIKHGPLPGFAGFGAASAHTELVLDEPRNPVIVELYGDKTPLQVDTTFGFGGGGRQVATSPAVEATLKDQTKLSWGEVRLVMDFERDMASYTASGGVPLIKIESGGSAGVVSLKDVKLEAKQKRMFEDDALSFVGPSTFSVAALDITGANGMPVVAENIVISSDSSMQGDFMDGKVGYGLQSLKIGPQVIGPSQIDIGIRHIHARSMSQINREYLKLMQNEQFMASGGEPNFELFKPMAKPMQTILESSPELAIDKLDLSLPQGKMTGKMVIRLPNAKVGDLETVAANPLVLMGLATAFELDGDLAMPEALVMETVGEERASMLAGLESEGYLKHADKVYSMTFKYAAGELKVNDKPVNMGQLGGMAGGQ